LNTGYRQNQKPTKMSDPERRGSVHIFTLADFYQGPCSLTFSGSGSRSGSSFKMNTSWTISNYLFKKTWFCLHWHGKCCFRHKMHNIKVRVGDNYI